MAEQGKHAGERELMLKNIPDKLHDEYTYLTDTLKYHPVYENPYFRSLKETPLTSAAFEVLRPSFFVRTRNTVGLIALGCDRAAKANDSTTLTLLSRILNEECGNGHPSDSHENLLEESFNLYGQRQFGLSALTVREAHESPLITPAALEYEVTVRSLRRTNYSKFLGVLLAVETHADPMLTAVRQAFSSHHEGLTPEEFASIDRYFSVHVDEKDGVEDRHAQDVFTCVEGHVGYDLERLREVRQGAGQVLDLQDKLWAALHQQSVEVA